MNKLINKIILILLLQIPINQQRMVADPLLTIALDRALKQIEEDIKDFFCALRMIKRKLRKYKKNKNSKTKKPQTNDDNPEKNDQGNEE
jgi:hypothetical protein